MPYEKKRKKKAGLAIEQECENTRKSHTIILTQKPRKATYLEASLKCASTIYFDLHHPTAQECLTELGWKFGLNAQNLKTSSNYSVLRTESYSPTSSVPNNME